MVTARKREESLQDIGQSVSAISQAQIERSFATDLRDLVSMSPNLVIDDTAQGPGGVAAAYIRGVGVAEVESNFDPAVATVVDGIYHGKPSGGILRTFDVASVEVLRGPQGTLFGRNAIGGVIKIERTQPTGELGGKVAGSYGAYDTYEAEGVFNFGVGDDLAIKLSGARREQGTGYFRNLNTGRHDGEMDFWSFGVNALYTPFDNLELEYSYELECTDQDTPPLLYVGQPGQLFCDAFGFCAPSTDVPLSGDRYATLQFGPPPPNEPGASLTEASFDVDTHIAEARWDINDRYRLDYVFGYRRTDEEVWTDWDAVPPLLFHTTRPEKYSQYSHELRLTYDSPENPLSYVLGAYRWDSEYKIPLVSYIGFIIPGVTIPVPRTSHQVTDSYAIFFDADYRIGERWTLNVGGRYSHDKKSSQHWGFPTIDKVSESWGEYTPKVGLRFQWHDDLLLYALYSVGYRSGGFVGRPETIEAATIPYDPEFVDNYEVGFKSEWLDNRLRLNGTFFYMEYDDKQEEVSVPVSIGTGQQTIIENVASATVMGIELDFLAYLGEGLTLNGNFGWLDAEYDEFDADLVGSDVVVDNSHLEFRRAPEITIGLAATYERSMFGGLGWARIGYHYLDEHEVSLFNTPQTHNDAQHLVDGSINFQYRNVQVSLFGRNLLEEDGYTIGFDVAGPQGLWTYVAPRAPRTWGLEVSYAFGAQ